jgi:DNA-binding NarL/FixJ family response regulator
MTLQRQPELRVIGQAADGLEAIRAAQELQPHLVLLDIGLPILNGIEAARRIREVSPKSRILCVSEHRSRDIAEEALGVGASGYVIKSQGGGELLRAVRTVLNGQRFVSASLRLNFDDPASPVRESGPEHADVPKVVASVPPLRTKTRNRHEVEFYSDDGTLLEDVTRFIGTALKAGNAAIVVATEPHRKDLLPRLQAFGVNMSLAMEEGRYLATDAADGISKFVTNGKLDTGRFVAMYSDLIVTATKAARAEHPRVVIFGEGSYILWTRGDADAAIQDEKICTELTEKYEVDILCGYSLSGFQRERDAHVFEQICAEHSAVHSG